MTLRQFLAAASPEPAPAMKRQRREGVQAPLFIIVLSGKKGGGNPDLHMLSLDVHPDSEEVSVLA